jgi:hypothetical protein
VNGQSIHLHQILPLAKSELDRASLAERDRKKPEALRSALRQYVDRELLLQEAFARGVQADAREVEWPTTRCGGARRHQAWSEFLAQQGLDPQSLRTELHATARWPRCFSRRAAGQGGRRRRAALLARLRARARIELLL